MGATHGSDDHRFGGDWTQQKLDVLAGYLHAYTTALKDKPTGRAPFRKAYIDAFAGTGYRAPSHDASGTDDDQLALFPDLASPAPRALLDGSARRALQVTPGFDTYIFIEKSRDRCEALERLRDEFPEAADSIQIRRGDANEEIRALCGKRWRSHRAVLFLDPYGMQVEWKTIEAVARTKAIDLWLLLPLGIGVNRLLTRSGEIPVAWRRRLDLLLGTSDWADEFYRVEQTQNLFGDEYERVEKATLDSIGKYFVRRLQSVFVGVAEPGVLRNSSNNPLYLLCFAVGNLRGRDIALRIATDLLKGLH